MPLQPSLHPGVLVSGVVVEHHMDRLVSRYLALLFRQAGESPRSPANACISAQLCCIFRYSVPRRLTPDTPTIWAGKAQLSPNPVRLALLGVGPSTGIGKSTSCVLSHRLRLNE